MLRWNVSADRAGLNQIATFVVPDQIESSTLPKARLGARDRHVLTECLHFGGSAYSF
jgi:hypothetical protein